MADRDIICERRGAAGLVTLNRPQALNALTHGMVRDLDRALAGWERDPEVGCVVVTGAGGRAFSAGGDVRAIYDQCRAGRHAETMPFFAEEYRLNLRIETYPKPYVSLIDGIVMGGGVGISLHGSHRVAAERYRFAMPEVAIGFIPDVGATYALPRLPGSAGIYLALTGARIGPADAFRLGLATHLARAADFDGVTERLVAGEPADAVLGSLARPDAGPGPVTEALPVIAACFSAGSVGAVLDRLDDHAARGSAFARDTAAEIRTKSPTSLALAFEQMRRGPGLTFADATALEYELVGQVLHGHDFFEGVRAALVDKDGRPVWDPATLADLDPATVAAHFAAFDRRERGP